MRSLLVLVPLLTLGCDPSLQGASDPPDEEPPVAPGEEQAEPYSGPQPFAVPESCDAVVAEAAWCATTTGASVELVGLASGERCTLVEGQGLSGVNLGAGDGRVHVSSRSGEALVTVDVDDGTLTESSGWGDSIRTYWSEDETVYRHDVFGASGLQAFASWEDALEGQNGAAVDYEPWATRFGGFGDSLVGAWHSTPTFELHDLTTGETESVALGGYDDWVLGIDLLDEERVAYLDVDRTLVVWNFVDGVEELRREDPDRRREGLLCFPGE